MHRFFSFAVLFNWLIVVAMIGLLGFGLSENSVGLISKLTFALTAEQPFALSLNVAHAISIVAGLSVLTAGLWALMAILFADDSEQHGQEQAFVVGTSLGYCLILFALLVAFGMGVSNYEIGALASVASLATVLAGIAHRVMSVERQADVSTIVESPSSFSALRAQSMATQSARLAAAGARSARFVPKQRFSSYYTNQ